MSRLRRMWHDPAGRGFLMLAAMAALFGFAMNAQQNIVTNFFEEVLRLKGPQFGYITAIREVPAFLLIFLSALFYRISLQRVTAGALVLLAVGYALFGFAHGFWGVVPWIMISSMGYHTVLQTQLSLGMNLTTEDRSGSILGKMAAFGQAGTLVALVMVFVVFHYGLLSFRPTFIILGVAAFLAACAIAGFPHLHEGRLRATAARRDPIVLRREYRLYYALCLLDGGRQQIFFSFGLWVLVNRFHLTVAQISAVLLVVTFAGMMTGPWVGRLIDRYGERPVLSATNVAYVAALAGYAFTGNVAIACLSYVVYSFIMMLSPMAGATYLRKIALAEEVAPSLAMGVTLQHATAVVVPVAAGFILNFVGYQVPFLIACGFACLAFGVTRRLNPASQRCAARVAADEARFAAEIDVAEAEAVLLGADAGGGENVGGLGAIRPRP